MLVYEFFRWWYGPGWIGVGRGLNRRLSNLAEAFSVDLLLRTLFAPWRRIVSYPEASLGAHFHALIDNFVSRCIGFIVRLSVIIAAGLSAVVLLILGVGQLVAWPVLPPIALGLIVWGLL